MEYALWAWEIRGRVHELGVLILILMEYALWVWQAMEQLHIVLRLNPYSNGICSMRQLADGVVIGVSMS